MAGEKTDSLKGLGSGEGLAQIGGMATKAIKYGLWPLLALDLAGGVAGGVGNYLLGSKQLKLQQLLGQGQLEAAKAGNEANRQAAAEYMQMLRDEKGEGRKDKNWDRRMQLVMMMLAGMNQFGRQAIDTAVSRDLPAPPMAMTTLLRGM